MNCTSATAAATTAAAHAAALTFTKRNSTIIIIMRIIFKCKLRPGINRTNTIVIAFYQILFIFIVGEQEAGDVQQQPVGNNLYVLFSFNLFYLFLFNLIYFCW